MRLSYNAAACNDCTEKKCFYGCPNGISNIAAFDCQHCCPEDAACMQACKQHAIFEISRGILAVDRELCKGCGACSQECKKRAIVVEYGKAKKCDLCAANNFEIACMKACEKKSLFVVLPSKEQKLVSGITGWRIRKFADHEKNKILKQGGFFEIIEARDSEKKYLLKGVPQLSQQEARLFRAVLADFQSGAKKNNNIEKALEKYCIENLVVLDEEQKQYLQELLESTAFNYGPLTQLLENNDIEEIAIIGLKKPVFVFDNCFGWLETNLYYCSETEVKNLVNRMAQKLGRRLTMQTPKLNAVLEDGSRLCASIEPVSYSGPAVTIRKFRHEPFTPVDLIGNNTISAEATAFLWMAMQTDCSVLIAGNTGSGKTSTLNALFSFIPKNERIVTVEETPEIRLPHSHIVKLNVAENLGIGMKHLIVDSLRMRPDRIIVGEIRNNEETLAFIDTLLAGQGKGSYATFHAQSAAETTLRLKSIGVNELDIASIDLVVVQRRWNKIESSNATEQRRVIEISEVLNENNEAKLNCLFRFDYKKSSLERLGESRKVFEKLEKCFGMGKKGIEKELRKRTVFLRQLQGEKPKLEDFFEEVNRYA